ncbi:MAG: UDP-glucose 4-epimerase GalE [Candidatus Puniceispirillaceae bacterium]
MRVLVTGGSGYIGSHTLLPLLHKNHEVYAIDNFANSSPATFDRVSRLSNQTFSFDEVDVTDKSALIRTCEAFKPEAVIHFAGLKAVGESSEKPLLYYQENLVGTLNILAAMEQTGCKHIVFSSSATVYGTPQFLPYTEQHPLQPMNTYGRTKYISEEMIKDWARTDPAKSAMLLRYFNPVGAHPSGQMGEDPSGIPNNLMPFIAQVAIGRLPHLNVFGDDFDTKDGTGVRDYIHVTDLADGHVKALNYICDHPGVEAVNLGTGNGVSVLEMIAAFEQASGKSIPYQVKPRREGDLPAFWADSQKAKTLLGWQATKTIDDMCRDSWAWQSQNPQGYGQD